LQPPLAIGGKEFLLQGYTGWISAEHRDIVVWFCIRDGWPETACVAVAWSLQVCSQSSLTKAIAVVEDTRNAQLAPVVLDALAACEGLEGHMRDALRFRLNLAAGQLGDAARDALELAQFEQVRFVACCLVTAGCLSYAMGSPCNVT
jgi:hypothetical protein